MSTLSRSALGGALLMGLSSMGCVDVEPFGDAVVEVTWAVAPLGCEELAVEEVRVSLSKGTSRVESTFPCEARRGVINGLPPGTYSLSMEGLNGQGETRFGAPAQDLFLRPDETTRVPLVDLVALPATLWVSWYFENQRVCGANGVDEVEVAVFDQGYYEVSRGSFDCDLGAVPVDGLRSGEVWVQVRGVSADQTYAGLTSLALKQGGESSVDVVLIEAQNQP